MILLDGLRDVRTWTYILFKF